MLLITNNGILSESWNTIKDVSKINTPIDKNINHYYGDSVLFSEDLTIGGFFTTMYKYKDKIEEDFISYTQCSNLQPFYDQMNKEVDIYTQLEHPVFIQRGIVIKHSSSISTHKLKDETGKVQMRNYVNSWNQLIGFDKTDVQNPLMGITLEYLNNIKHFPLKLDMHYNLVQINPYDKDVVLATNLINHFTLFDIVAILFTELTFIDAIDTQDIKPVEDLIYEDTIRTIRDKKNQLEIAKSKEMYEKCQYLQNEIDQLETLLRSHL